MSNRAQIKAAVRRHYSSLALSASEACCGPASVACCGPSSVPGSIKLRVLGYSAKELRSLPSSVVSMSAGCGNPTGLGMIREGETVLDLGSGGGIDVFLASQKVGPRGRVIGLDMTPEMIRRAESNARAAKLDNVEFRKGEIENLPLADGSVDVVISNCVICLSPDKEAAFREMYRVLRAGGRLAIADEIARRPFSSEERSNSRDWSSCVTGAITEKEYAAELRRAGFTKVYVKRLRPSVVKERVFSAFVSALKPLN